MAKIKKSKPVINPQIVKTESDPTIRFSFKFFSNDDAELCPRDVGDNYTHALMERLRDLSSWPVKRFTGVQDKTIRNHQHDWGKTARPNGFQHLNEHFRAYPGWQFCISANEHGRVHGIIIDDTFYVVWLDHDHALYPAP